MNVRRANLDDAFIILLLLKEMHEGAVLNIPDIKLECLANKVDSLIKTGIVFISYNDEGMVTNTYLTCGFLCLKTIESQGQE